MIEYYKNLSLEPIHYIDKFGQPCIEQFKDVEGYENIYQVSNLGRIKSFYRGGYKRPECGYMIKRQCFDNNGYLLSSFSKNNKAKTLKTHRLVALAFIPNPKNLPEVNHWDTNKSNNFHENLIWSTCGDNVRHSWENGLCTSKKGEERHNVKLKESEVLEIRSKYAFKTYGCNVLGKEYGVAGSVIFDIIKRKIWKHI